MTLFRALIGCVLVCTTLETINAETFYQNNNFSNIPGPNVILLDFYSQSCGPCRGMIPTINELIKRGYNIRKVDTQREPLLARQYSVKMIPCFVIVADGREVQRVVGPTSAEHLATLMCNAGATTKIRTPKKISSSSDSERHADTRTSSPVTNPRMSATSGTASHTSVNPKVSTIPVTEDELLINSRLETLPTESRASRSSQSDLSRINEAENTHSGKMNTPVNIKSPGTATPLQNREDIIAATVRIHIKGHNGGVGSGTVIDARNGRALILTCGHIFRGLSRSDLIEVEFFGPNYGKKVSGSYIAHDDQNFDVGLLSVPVHFPVKVAPVAPMNTSLKQGAPIITSGCSYGQDATLQSGIIIRLSHYENITNMWVSAVPVSGRSGGGAFSENGYLIGICNAADAPGNEGLFRALNNIHQYLTTKNLAGVIHNPVNETLLAYTEINPKISEEVKSPEISTPHTLPAMPVKMPEPQSEVQLTGMTSPSTMVNAGVIIPVVPDAVTTPQQPMPSPVIPISPLPHTAAAATSLIGTPLPAWPPIWKN